MLAGSLGAIHGLRGELTCIPTRIGEGSIVAGARFLLERDTAADTVPVKLTSVRRHHGRLIVSLEGIATADAAQSFTGARLLLRREDVPLANGEYLDDDLVGLAVIDEESGAELGTISAVRHYPAQDCLVVAPPEALVPMVREFVKRVDLARRRVLVTLPPGLLDDALAENA